MFDLLIKNGIVVDGTGNPWYKADIGIKDERIANIGRIPVSDAVQTIDADRLVVSPGFIDIHTHSDFSLLIHPSAESMVRQGITSNLIGNCGMSAAPISETAKAELVPRYLDLGLRIDWCSMHEYLNHLEKQGTAINVAPLVGHSTVRMAVMGMEDRDPSKDELDDMKKLIVSAMTEGAFGFSTGLIYPPSMYSKTAEIVELAKVAAMFDGIYATHPRGEGETFVKATTEAIAIGEKAGIRVELAHHCPSVPSWGKQRTTIRMVEDARRRGIDIAFDVIPYNGTLDKKASSAISVRDWAVLPGWVLADGKEKMMTRLKNPAMRRRIKHDMLDKTKTALGRCRSLIKYEAWEKIALGDAKKPENIPLIGKTLREISEIQGLHPVEVLLELMTNERDQDLNPTLSLIWAMFREEDVQEVLKHSLSAPCTDTAATSIRRPLGETGPMTRRTFGTFPKILCEYVRRLNLLSLEEAIRKMTSHPAQRIGIKDRGLIFPHMYADLVIFNYNTISEEGTIFKPSYPKGIEYVVVNGQLVVNKRRHTGTLSGKTLRHSVIRT